MKIVEITLKEGLFKKQVKFSEFVNMVYSQQNSSGKTTFIRSILYAMGYSIPSTKGINFDDMEFWIILENDKKKYMLYRHASYLSIDDGVMEKGYSLPTDFHEIQTILTGCKNVEVLDNLIGAFYMDQEKGWTLLNRGKVIGSIGFNIEALVRGLAGKNCSDVIQRLDAVKRELRKYEYMHSVAQYQKEISEAGENIVYDSSDEIIERDIEMLKTERIPIDEELKQIKNILRKNKLLAEYISEMKLIVQGSKGEEIPVTQETLLGFLDNNDFLVARRELLAGDVAQINKRISSLESRKKKEQTLFKVQTIIEEFDTNISKIRVDSISTQQIINKLKTERKKLQEEIRRLTKADNSIVDELHKCISGYAREFGVSEIYVVPQKDYIFTNDLKSLSGTILHKIVFSFKLAYIKVIREETGLILPIILDSPSGREVKLETIQDMLNILQRDFNQHQIIIASIHNFEMINKKIIEFKGRLFDENEII